MVCSSQGPGSSKLHSHFHCSTMIKAGLEIPSHERVFIRQALFENGIRLDGRGIGDYRPVDIKLSRAESCSTCEVQLGSTLVIAVVTGEIITPYADRPVEGTLQFTAHISPHTEIAGLNQWELTRMLDRTLKESEAIDTESLCIVGGERVWQINCAVSVVDGSGGNVMDACMLAVIAALKAFRKPDVSIIPVAYLDDDATTASTKGFNITPSATSASKANVNILVHHSNNREPLPLALHHTPITVTLGIFKGQSQSTSGDSVAKEEGAVDEGTNSGSVQRKIVLLSDPSRQEELAQDGKITFSINAHQELCAVSKPAGRGLSANVILQAAKIANECAAMLHHKLNLAVAALEADVQAQRERDLAIMQKYNQLAALAEPVPAAVVATKTQEGERTGDNGKKSKKDKAAVGIDRNDPILQWSTLHQAAGLWE